MEETYEWDERKSISEEAGCRCATKNSHCVKSPIFVIRRFIFYNKILILSLNYVRNPKSQRSSESETFVVISTRVKEPQSKYENKVVFPQSLKFVVVNRNKSLCKVRRLNFIATRHVSNLRAILYVSNCSGLKVIFETKLKTFDHDKQEQSDEPSDSFKMEFLPGHFKILQKN